MGGPHSRPQSIKVIIRKSRIYIRTPPIWPRCYEKMIIHKLVARHLRHMDDPKFYLMQAQDAVAWLEKKGVELSPTTHALDLGCGHGIFGAELLKRGCQVEFADEVNYLTPDIDNAVFKKVNVEEEDDL